MMFDDWFIIALSVVVGLWFTLKERFTYRDPRIFQHGGVYVKVWDKWYRVFATEDARMKKFRGDDEDQ